MYIEKLSLKNFRNYKNLNIDLCPSLNILFGDNAQGKTNILEAVYIAAMGRSQKGQKDSQIIKLNQDEAHIQVFSNKNQLQNRIDVHLKKDSKKGIAVNGIPIKKSSELFGNIYVVIFSPEDLNLIKNGPSERRRFMDMEMCQLSAIYYYDLQQYYKILKQRNNLLKTLQRNMSMKETLFAWDCQLIDYGKKIINSRTNFINKINDISCEIHKNITAAKEILKINYMPNISIDEFEDKLNRHIERDIMIGSTSVGPHKDDLLFFINNDDVRIYGSQGQQRTTALSIKLAEIKLIEEETSYEPILLLDDVLSELDESRQFYLLENIKNVQTIITCTGIEDTIKKYIDKAKIYKIKNGEAFVQ